MRKKIFIATLMIFSLVLLSCKKDSDNISYEDEVYRDVIIDDYGHRSSNEGMIVLGAKLNDPYRYETMLQARNELMNEKIDVAIPVITATHKYMRVLPRNEELLDIIKADTNILFFDYPLHYEIVTMGCYYHDPSIADTLPTWQYCVVPTNYTLPNEVKFELIYELYFPPENVDNIFYTRLEEKAFQITGNLDENYTRASSWRPSATIKAYDDIVGGYIPLQGVKVTARRFTKVRTGITNADGYCTVDGTFKYPVNYSIKWERAYWDIRNGAIGQAYYNGPKQRGKWTLNIGKGGKSLMFATIHRAAYKFYYGNCLGLQRPILNTGKTKIAYFNKDAWWGTGCCWGTWDITGIVPNIMIAHPNSTKTNLVFGTTIHELGHLSHLITLEQNLYANLDKEIHESWAAAIEWRLTNHHYNNEQNKTYSHSYDYQDWHPCNLSNGKTDCYTPLFIDLMDDFNQNINNSIYPHDMISDYKISYIQKRIIPTSRSLETFYSTLKNNKISSVTDNDIDIFMTLYWDQDYSR